MSDSLMYMQQENNIFFPHWVRLKLLENDNIWAWNVWNDLVWNETRAHFSLIY